MPPEPGAPPGPSAPARTDGGPAVVLRPPGSLRILAGGLAVLALLLAGVAALLFAGGVLLPGCCVAVAVAVLAIVVTPILSGRAVLRDAVLDTRTDPAKTYTVPWHEVHALETRRRLLTEVVAFRRGEQWVELGAPRRWRLRPDPAFTAALSDLATRSGREPSRGARRTPVGKLVVLAVAAVVYVLVFALAAPIWHSPVWPGRHEAVGVPRACPVLAPAAAALGERAKPVETPTRTYGTRTADHCAYGTSLSLTYELYRYSSTTDGGTEQAQHHLTAAEQGRRPSTTHVSRTPGIADAAITIVATYPGQPGNVNIVRVTARKANVLIRLSYQPDDNHLGGKSVSAATQEAHRLARSAASQITIH